MKVAAQYAPGLVNDDIWTEYTMEQFFENFAMESIGVLSQEGKDMLLGSALIFGCQYELNITVVRSFAYEVYAETGVEYFFKVVL